ncbi:GNAT family N-acetyltransferase [Calothrix sp. UHCC 0171]|uniref:GNAT family N-acetyltransferase n=1 Tax=Calothrix sp. UHCC 0171 TaxID=3110245 RepID=UPI002B218DB2|nr:GNAT family N-acetyltransferase [Calothrix sp. UHCC 0171]MEA5573457.1 GNAT family N-acetyltransferase [Calothrix sp. UHCC 0171]
MTEIHILQSGDEAILEAFLIKHATSSMFLRSNLCAVGLKNNGQPFQGKYAAAIADGQIVAVAAHYWNGMIILQAPAHLESVVTSCLELEKRGIFGITGPAKQVEDASKILGLERQQFRIAEREIMFSLELSNLTVPMALVTGNLECRFPIPSELELLAEWSVAYQVEALGQLDTPELRAKSHQTLEKRQADKSHFCLVRRQTPVAYCTFNARLPDIVQIGGVWTPPELRGNGYAKSVVAGALVYARLQGVKRAVLFTSPNNIPAQSAYRAIGFQPTGEEYGLFLL